MARDRIDQALREWVEELAILFERDGLPRMAGRIFGWLLVCEPPHQTMDELAAALHGSKASMSTMTRLLVQAGLVDRIRLPGERRDHFRIPEDWDALWRSRIQLMQATTDLLGRGCALVAGRRSATRRRLEELHEQYQWFGEEVGRMVARWERLRRGRPRRNAGAGSA